MEVVLGLLFYGFIIYLIIKKIKKNKSTKEININYKDIYCKRRYAITLNELKFYKVLMEIAQELDLILFSQVSLYNIVEMKENLPKSIRYKFFNKIASKSIDFVFVDKESCRIKLCIELDDSTHNRPNRIKRDKFINDLFKDLEINLLRYPVYKVYYKETIKNHIIQKIKPNI